MACTLANQDFRGVMFLSDIDDLDHRIRKGPDKENKNNELLHFFLGIILVAIGIFMVFQYTTVSTVWYTWRIGSLGVPSGAVAIPLLIGIGLLFYNSKSVIGLLVVILGILFILVTIILSVQIRFTTTSLFEYVLMFGMLLAGAGLLLKSLFRSRKN